MADRYRDSSLSGNTEEIFLDEEEFERLLNEETGEEEIIIEEEPEEDLTVVYGRAEIENALDDSGDIDEYGTEYSEEVSEEYAEEYEETPKHSRLFAGKRKTDDDEDDDDEDDDDDESVVSIFSAEFFNKLVYLLGGLIALFAIIVGVVIITAKTGKLKAGTNMSEVGVELEDIDMIGKQSIDAVFGHEAARLSALYEAAESFEYSEVDEETGLVNVTLALTTIQKDLKIKFVNRNNKLVANVPFKVEVTDSKGKTTTYTDDDKDGIIYLTDIASGDYTVKMLPLNDFSALYAFSTDPSTNKVKDQIEYAKVDVSNEIKKESEAGAKDGQKKAHDTEVEGTLQDTVEFVMTQKVALTDTTGFTKIDKSNIADPKDSYKSASAAGDKTARFRKLEGDVSPSDPTPANEVNLSLAGSVYVGETIEASVTGGQISTITFTSGNPAVASVTQDASNSAKATVKGESVGSCDIIATATFTDGTSKEARQTVSVSVKPVEAKFSVSGIPATMIAGQTATATYSATGTDGNEIAEANRTITWSSDNTAVATVDNSGKITAVAAGTAKIKAVCVSAANNLNSTAEATVTVTAQSFTIKLNYSELYAFYGADAPKLEVTFTGDVANKEVTWTSSKEDVVKVSDTGALTIVNKGEATVTCASKADNTKTAACTIKVVEDPTKDTSKKLLDKEGKQVYKKDSSGKYVEAVYADYYSGVELYTTTAVSYKYMGWWTVDGKTYYYDKNGNKVTGDQVILGTKYSFSSEGILLTSNGTFGIDVSSWQGLIDWNSVAKSGVSFAIIRCGFRGSTVGGLFEDSKFYTNIKNANGAGIKVGIYFFSQATNEVEAVEEASMVLHMVEKYNVSYPIFLDVENSDIYPNGRADGIDRTLRTKVIAAFCQTINNSGYKGGVYANKYWLNNMLNAKDLTQYKIWLAQYNSEVTYTTTRYDLWQYSSKGSINGISGNVDLNHSYLGY